MAVALKVKQEGPVVMDLFCALTRWTPIAWLESCAIVLQDVLIGGNWVKGSWDLFVFFLKTACESEFISK